MSTYECPYTSGAEFTFLLNLPPYDNASGSEDSPPMRGEKIRVQVIETYSFTKSQTMKVSTISTECESVPATAFLKLYDRRYLDERMTADTEYAWNHEKEAEAEAIAHLRGISTNPTTVGEDSSVEDSSDVGSADSEEDSGSGETDNEELDQWDIEEIYRDSTKEWFRTETEAYSRLQSLQSVVVPRFLGTVKFDANSLAQMPPGVLTEVNGILLQFIDGKRLDEIKARSIEGQKYEHLGEAAVICFERIIPLGVLHGDVRLANLMVRNSDGRVFLIDFAQATIRRKSESDEEWAQHARTEREASGMKDILQRVGLRERSPPEPFVIGSGGYGYFNSLIGSSSGSWTQKYYEKISDEEGFEMRSDENGEWKWIFPNWRVRQDAAVQRRQYLDGIRRCVIDAEADDGS